MTTGGALAQIRERGCAEKFRGRAEETYLVGGEFDPAHRNTLFYQWERACECSIEVLESGWFSQPPAT